MENLLVPFIANEVQEDIRHGHTSMSVLPKQSTPAAARVNYKTNSSLEIVTRQLEAVPPLAAERPLNCASASSENEMDNHIAGEYSKQKLRPRKRPRLCAQMKALFIREVQGTYRNLFSLLFRVFTPVLQVVLYSVAFLHVGRYLAQGKHLGDDGTLAQLQTEAQFSARIRELFISVATVFFMAFTAGAQIVLLNIPAERSVFLREYTSNMYSTWMYLLSKMLVELPLTLLQTLLIVVILQAAYGTNASFWWLWFLMFLCMTSG
ncbi:unnamed protein product, partial [Amoebophrya sp. A25]|eukprot:GSA25T00013427001.1